MVSHSGLITVMQRAARKAAPRLRRDFGEVEQLQVSRKGPADFVSMADKQAEQTLVEELAPRPPGLAAAARGRRRDRGRSRQAALDRRSARRHLQLPPRHPAFRHLDRGRGSEAGRAGRGEITQALVYQPLTDESFWAEKGRGAWLNERRLRVSARRDLADALIATGVPWKGTAISPASTRSSTRSAPEVAGIRRFGSAALDLAWVAAGRFDGFWEEDLQLWDIAAGILLVREAGGFVTDFRGGDAGAGQGPGAGRQRPAPFEAAQAGRGSASARDAGAGAIARRLAPRGLRASLLRRPPPRQLRRAWPTPSRTRASSPATFPTARRCSAASSPPRMTPATPRRRRGCAARGHGLCAEPSRRLTLAALICPTPEMTALRQRFGANRRRGPGQPPGDQRARPASAGRGHRLDARTGRLFAATVVGRALLVREARGWRAIEGLEAGSLFGLAIDQRRRLLWVASGVVEQTPSPETAFRGLIAVDLATLRPVAPARRRRPRLPGRHRGRRRRHASMPAIRNTGAIYRGRAGRDTALPSSSRPAGCAAHRASSVGGRAPALRLRLWLWPGRGDTRRRRRRPARIRREHDARRDRWPLSLARRPDRDPERHQPAAHPVPDPGRTAAHRLASACSRATIRTGASPRSAPCAARDFLRRRRPVGALRRGRRGAGGRGRPTPRRSDAAAA